MELKDLVGVHKFSGAQFFVLPPEEDSYRYEDAQSLSFILDGKVYTAVEDPSDGYRSTMREIREGGAEVTNTFAPQKVLAMMRGNCDYREVEILDLIDLKTALVVLSVGTDYGDSYYPSWVGEFNPENMAINK